MMHGPEKSDSSIVAMKLTNKPIIKGAELMEPRGEAKGNTEQQRTRRTQSRVRVSQRLDRVRQAAKQRKERFTALMHHINVDLLYTAFYWLKRDAAAGVDGTTWREYEVDLEARLKDLHQRIHNNTYRAQPSRRQYIPKQDGQQRPLGIAALEDKIVQRAVVEVLNAVYEQDFLGYSYGFRPGRGQHDALDALAVGIDSAKVNWILDADIRRFFDTVSHEWLTRFLEHRIGDPRILRLIRKWLKAGVMEDGTITQVEEGVPQGAVISPLLANIYLHYVFDLWANQWRKRYAQGQVIIVRYADDIVVGFESVLDAKRFREALQTRIEQFGLALNTEKTRLIEFGRYAAANRARRGLGKPESFNFLGFTHICGRSRKGNFRLRRKSRRDRVRAKLREIKAELRRRMHHSIPEQGKWLRQVITGFFAYHAVPTNSKSLSAFRYHVIDLWRRTLKKRSQKDRTRWDRISNIADYWLPAPRILHPWPRVRFAVKHPRWEPGA
ncbi:MAG: group II intron reverse transcriptase/maturase [Firmicutes bacterium]|nr:group II intron reverse transcriptase/maturase [Bacillota bacterium]